MFKDILREARERAELTQFDLAVQSGVSLPAIQKYEGGSAVPGWKNLIKLNGVLDLRDALTEPATGGPRHTAWSSETRPDLRRDVLDLALVSP